MKPVGQVGREWFARVGDKIRARRLAEKGRETPRIVCQICEDVGVAYWLHTDPYPHVAVADCACITKQPIPPNATCAREACLWESPNR